MGVSQKLIKFNHLIIVFFGDLVSMVRFSVSDLTTMPGRTCERGLLLRRQFQKFFLDLLNYCSSTLMDEFLKRC